MLRRNIDNTVQVFVFIKNKAELGGMELPTDTLINWNNWNDVLPGCDDKPTINNLMQAGNKLLNIQEGVVALSKIRFYYSLMHGLHSPQSQEGQFGRESIETFFKELGIDVMPWQEVKISHRTLAELAEGFFVGSGQQR